MAPIYDTDIASERWSKQEWTHYELWEKIEIRLRRRKWLWLGIVIFIFLLLSSIPVLLDQYPHWQALKATRILAEEISHLKREAALDKAAYRLRFENPAVLRYVVEKGTSCSAPQGWSFIREGALGSDRLIEALTLLDGRGSGPTEFKGLQTEFCYDAFSGSGIAAHENEISGFSVIPVKDLAENRFDRATVLTISGPSAEISFE